MFKPNTLFYTDGYKPGHKPMLAPGTDYLYGTWIARNFKHAPQGIKKAVSFGQQLVWTWLHDEFKENFFSLPEDEAMSFAKDLEIYLGLPFDGEHYRALHQLGYLPMRVKALPEGIEVGPNIPHMTFVNTVKGFAWLTLYLETIVSSLAWKPSTSATISKQYRRNLVEWVMKTDPDNAWLIDFLAHDFSARGLSPWDMLSSGLGHATSFRGSDSLITIPGARYFYHEPKNEVIINSVLASEHSVTCTGIFYYEMNLKAGNLNHEIEWYYSFKDIPAEGSVENPDYLAIAECLNLRDWLIKFPKGILSVVSDTFDLWKLITFILPRLKSYILAREGKLVIRPDSGDPVDIICGTGNYSEDGSDSFGNFEHDRKNNPNVSPQIKGVIELLWDIFGGTVNEQGYKLLDSHIGAIYGDSITLDRQVKIYDRLASKGFAATNIVLGIGSFTYQYNTRDTLGFAAKGGWFSSNVNGVETSFSIYKDPITDDGTKKSPRGKVAVHEVLEADPTGKLHHKDYILQDKCTDEEEEKGILQVIYENGQFRNPVTFTEIRERLLKAS